MSARAEALLERALAAEETAELLTADLRKLQNLLGNVMEADPVSAVQALTYIARCKAAEKLVRDAITLHKQRYGEQEWEAWRMRAEAQMKAAEVSDGAVTMEPPADNDYWNSPAVPSIRESLREITSQRGRQ